MQQMSKFKKIANFVKSSLKWKTILEIRSQNLATARIDWYSYHTIKNAQEVRHLAVMVAAGTLIFYALDREKREKTRGDCCTEPNTTYKGCFNA